MVTLHIEHAISDFSTWKQAFDQFADMRRSSGVLRHRVHRPSDDDRYVLIDLDFDTRDEATKFLEFLTTRVWSTPANAPALVGTPHTRLLQLVEQS
ncbi:hypothetical protein GCM10009555_046680 [Acrocarpospora macrocephala]|uniref:Cyclase n=1 Tax=Acrocarpospora macrocephala TaxID=150177 RepID=A0A5M3WTL0_9ACTN|nr:hypothetical protein [Acrocarpospora macrocephala]GES12010.1 hypothetical protein Amac_056070 [Acrocarpospora macrocephala]